jgi:flagellar FliL protein
MSAAAAAATADAPEAPKKKGKKLLFIIVGVLVLAIAGAAGALFILKKNTAEGDAEEEAPVAHAKKVDPKHAPTFLPLENMVVNLADTGGNRYIQIGLTLQLQDAATGEAVKAYMPSIRSAVLMLLAKRTSEQVLSAEGKDQLNQDIIAAVSEVMGYEVDDHEEEGSKKKKRRAPPNPVQAVLFSSFIVQ